MMDEKVASLLVHRLIQARRREALERACTRSWLDAEPGLSAKGVELTRFNRGAAVNELASIAFARREKNDQPDFHGTGAATSFTRMDEREPFPLGTEIDVDDPDFDAALTLALHGNQPTDRKSMPSRDRSDLSTEELVSSARSLAAPPAVDEVAGALLIAKALAGIGTTLALDTLNGMRPIVVFASPVEGFHLVLQRLFEVGLIPLGPREYRSIGSLERSKLAAARTSSRPGLINVAIKPDEMPSKWTLTKMFESHLPILIETATVDLVPRRLINAATLILDTGSLDPDLIYRIVETLRGVRPVETIGVDQCLHLDLTDLRMACRPGLGSDDIVKTLRGYAKENQIEGQSRNEELPSQRERVQSSRSSAKAPSVAVTVPSIEPTATRVENLAGYGEAKIWAEELKIDLDDWRSGNIRWADLAPRILLSGPPGCGKTTWAKALCNSLSLPLLATSAADWLTGGHLGEVLTGMDRAFSEAVARAPCILFVDEIDGIGSRGKSARSYDDYWTAVVNKALQLMDGAVRTEGVVVIGATNRPDAIDSALMRPGRLEKHITIAKPDVEALAAILLHHIGSDLSDLFDAAWPSSSIDHAISNLNRET